MKLANFFAAYVQTLAATIVLSALSATSYAFINGLDVYNGDGVINWSNVKSAGYDFAFVKATEGVNFIDARFATNMSGANAAGIYVGPYHLARPDSKSGVAWNGYNGGPFAYDSPTQTNRDAWFDATSEAADFLASIRPYYLQAGNTHFLPPVADIELSKIPDFGSTSLEKTFVSNWVQVFSDSIYNALGVRPIMYMSKSNANTYWTSAIANQHSLFWIAWYKSTGTTKPPIPSDTPLWQPWSFWQWSDGSDAIAQGNQIPGTSATIDHDRDVFSGTLAQLSSLKVQLTPGDYNHDDSVNAADYIRWRKLMSLPTAQYNAYSIAFLGADGNSSGKVDAADYSYWRSRFGKSLTGAGAGSQLDSSTVPEPASIVTLMCGFFALLARQRRRNGPSFALGGTQRC